jgi:hypothetical protein
MRDAFAVGPLLAGSSSLRSPRQRALSSALDLVVHVERATRSVSVASAVIAVSVRSGAGWRS